MSEDFDIGEQATEICDGCHEIVMYCSCSGEADDETFVMCPTCGGYGIEFRECPTCGDEGYVLPDAKSH